MTTIQATKADLAPFRPGEDGEWGRASACHLVRRAAFGMPDALVSQVEELGPQAAAKSLLSSGNRSEDIALLDDVTMRAGSFSGSQAWWIYRMLNGAPALEKLALFWHGHFATSNRKVQKPRLLTRQILLFHRLGRGRFRDLLLEISRDPAMVIWLDGNSNRRGRPNENYARELLELFSLGIGNYTEADIKEAARAFTGWHEFEGEFRFSRRSHDKGQKTVFGEKGDFGGEDIVKLCVEQKACAEFLAKKLFQFYVHHDPSAELVSLLADDLRSDDLNIGPFLERLLSSRLFYRADIRGSMVTTPVDFVVGNLATLNARGDSEELAKSMALMGQDLLQPPSVKGWDGDKAWINSTTLLARYRFAIAVADGDSLEVKWDDLPDDVSELSRRFFPAGLSDTIVSELEAASAGDKKLAVAGLLQLPENQYF